MQDSKTSETTVTENPCKAYFWSTVELIFSMLTLFSGIWNGQCWNQNWLILHQYT